MYNVHVLSDSTLFGLTYKGESRLVQINKSNGEEVRIGQIPIIPNTDVPNHILG